VPYLQRKTRPIVEQRHFAHVEGNYLKCINTGDIFKAVMTEYKFAKSERYKINGKQE